MHYIDALYLLQLTVDTYEEVVMMFAETIEQSENRTVEQSPEVLSTVANYFSELTNFFNVSSVNISTPVSIFWIFLDWP